MLTRLYVYLILIFSYHIHMNLNKTFFYLIFLLSCSSASASGFKLMVAGKGLYGSMAANEEALLEKRTMNGFGAEALLGYQYRRFIFGGVADYTKWYQSTEPKEVGNTNLQGSAVTYSAALGFVLTANLRLMMKYHFKSTYTLENKNSSEQEITYEDPDLSYSIQLHYALTEMTYVGLDYTSLTYGSATTAGTSSSLNDDSKINLTGFGVVYGLDF
jgi:hypothetical protein